MIEDYSQRMIYIEVSIISSIVPFKRLLFIWEQWELKNLLVDEILAFRTFNHSE